MVFCISGCGKSAYPLSFSEVTSTTSSINNVETVGRWREEKVDLGGMYYVSTAAVRTGTDCLTLYALDCDESYDIWGVADSKFHKFVSTDNGINWSMNETNWYDTLVGVPSVLCISANGQVLLGEKDLNGVNTNYWLQSATGILEPITFMGIDEFQTISSAAFINEDVLALSVIAHGDTELIVYSLANDAIIASAADTVDLSNAVSVDSTLEFIGLTTDGAKLIQLDESGREDILQESLPAASGSVGTTDSSGNYFYANSNGIYRIAKGGTIVEQVVDATGLALGIASPLSISVADSGDIFINYFPQAGIAGMYRYHWDNTFTSGNSNTLTIWSLEDNSTIRAAILECCNQNANLQIQYIPAMADETAQTKADAVKALNAEMLSGQGPDVIVFDGIDSTVFAEKGLLLDLSPIVERLDLVDNIIRPFASHDGSYYTLPAKFGVPIIIGDESDMSRLTSLSDVLKAIHSCPPRPDSDCTLENYYAAMNDSNRYGFSFMTPEQLLQFVMDTSAPALLTEDKTVNEQAVTELFTFIKDISDYYGMSSYRPAETQKSNGITISTKGDPVVFYDNVLEYEQTSHARYGWTTMLTTGLTLAAARVEGVYLNSSEGNTSPSYTILQRPGLVEGAFTPICLTGINSASQKVELAKEFVSNLFSKRVQDTFTNDGMPVNQAAI